MRPPPTVNLINSLQIFMAHQISPFLMYLIPQWGKWRTSHTDANIKEGGYFQWMGVVVKKILCLHTYH